MYARLRSALPCAFAFTMLLQSCPILAQPLMLELAQAAPRSPPTAAAASPVASLKEPSFALP